VGHWVVNALCIAMVALSVVASAEFAGPAFDAAVVSGNVGPALVASALRAPAFVLSRSH
jgi:Na+/glutamate symporter